MHEIKIKKVAKQINHPKAVFPVGFDQLLFLELCSFSLADS